MEVITGRGRFDGLYVWGPGWEDPSYRDKWNEYWDSFKGNPYWSHFRDGGTHHLVSVDGSVFMHPMGFNILLPACGTNTRAVEDLKAACEECVKRVGAGSFALTGLKVGSVV